jgi:uncharacterized damage-inducible protein DinB
MLSREFLRDLLRHMEWADAKVWSAVPDGTPADKRLTELLLHVHTVQQACLAVWTKSDVRLVFRGAEEFATLAALRDWARPYYAQAQAHIDGLGDADLNARLEMPWAAHFAQSLGRPAGSTTVAETCFQVCSHSTYHRGQVNARLREIGAEPPLVDYIAWLWFDRPMADWPPHPQINPQIAQITQTPSQT